jgi:hypothetical protein
MTTVNNKLTFKDVLLQTNKKKTSKLALQPKVKSAIAYLVEGVSSILMEKRSKKLKSCLEVSETSSDSDDQISTTSDEWEINKKQKMSCADCQPAVCNAAMGSQQAPKEELIKAASGSPKGLSSGPTKLQNGYMIASYCFKFKFKLVYDLFLFPDHKDNCSEETKYRYWRDFCGNLRKHYVEETTAEQFELCGQHLGRPKYCFMGDLLEDKLFQIMKPILIQNKVYKTCGVAENDPFQRIVKFTLKLVNALYVTMLADSSLTASEREGIVNFTEFDKSALSSYFRKYDCADGRYLFSEVPRKSKNYSATSAPPPPSVARKRIFIPQSALALCTPHLYPPFAFTREELGLSSVQNNNKTEHTAEDTDNNDQTSSVTR